MATHASSCYLTMHGEPVPILCWHFRTSCSAVPALLQLELRGLCTCKMTLDATLPAACVTGHSSFCCRCVTGHSSFCLLTPLADTSG